MPLNFIPQPGQSLGATRNLVLGNFNSIDEGFIVDHVDYNTAGQGKHNKITFPVQNAAPMFAAGEEGLYNLLYATTGKNEIFVHKQNQAGTVDIPFTASAMSNVVQANCVNGWSYLPSGLLIKWGQVARSGQNQNINVAGTSGGPNFNQSFQAYAVPFDTNAASNFIVRVNGQPNINSGNFLACSTGGTGTSSIVYLVIGV